MYCSTISISFKLSPDDLVKSFGIFSCRATSPPSFALEIFVLCEGESRFRRLCQPFLYSHSASNVLDVEVIHYFLFCSLVWSIPLSELMKCLFSVISVVRYLNKRSLCYVALITQYSLVILSFCNCYNKFLSLYLILIKIQKTNCNSCVT